MTSHFSFIIRALLAMVLLAASFFAGMAVSVVKTASIMRQLATEIREAQKRIKELEEVVTVSAEALDAGKVVVIGRLGSPLETMLTIRGTWRQSRMEKDSGLVFHVTHVNDPGEYQKELTGFAYVQAVPAWWRHFQTNLHGIMQRGGGDVRGRR